MPSATYWGGISCAARGPLKSGRRPLVTEQVPAQRLQCVFAQKLGIPLARLRKFNDLLSDHSISEIVCRP
jgi:hypothetical protein